MATKRVNRVKNIVSQVITPFYFKKHERNMICSPTGVLFCTFLKRVVPIIAMRNKKQGCIWPKPFL